ncbi:inovirus-type Gp2 protein [Lampropedia aestuarii]|uniref:inovirus-type Gp2 protein n=1 Tax=Lampropedia aestuarii TaxID=2562762 RepID=UPI0024694949|nr:inovirus-type Gp2 protein [Lampropedia aestuarii]MDH5859261.1 inovirus-type Gp2 protein [Lampropedia aestuarii]
MITLNTPTIGREINLKKLQSIDQCRQQFKEIYETYNTSKFKNKKFNCIDQIPHLYSLGLHLEDRNFDDLDWSSDPFLFGYDRWLNVVKSIINASESLQSPQWNCELTQRANDLLIEILQSEIFLTTMSSMQRLKDHNTCKMIDRVCGFKARHSKLMIVRVDIGFSNPPSELRIGCNKGHEIFKKSLDQLIKQTRNNYEDSYLHHEVKFEYAIDRGLHAHLLFLFNGSVVREDETIGLMIAKNWKSFFPDGVAWSYNDNNPARKAQLKPYGLALGVFGDDSPQFVKNVGNAVGYMAKPDYLLRIAFPGISRAVRSAHIDQHEWAKKMKRPMVQERMRKMGF